MPDNGYFKVWRRLIDSEFWLSEKFTRPQAWVDLIGLANHKPKSFRVRGILVKVERGQVARSILGLSERWKWSRKKVMRVLEEWKQDNKVHTKSDNITTLITIINYDEWQGDVTPNDTPKVTPEAHQTHTKRHTNNNEKNKSLFLDYVFLSEEDLKTLKEYSYKGKLLKESLNVLIEELDSYLTNNQKKRKEYKDHKKVLMTWFRRRVDNGQAQASQSSLLSEAGEKTRASLEQVFAEMEESDG